MTSQEISDIINPNHEEKKPDEKKTEELHNLEHLPGMYKNWFLDYASYVILERAVPHINDGLKPVQRRILHSMKRMDDGRYNKVANIIGHTMQFHPHGDASIGEALVQLGQKNLLIDTQGNWGNILTGDNAAAARYIEARLSKFALEVAFNAKTTNFVLSYDGRNEEPQNLPMKFPLLLAQGVEGIAVGLASKILPHNFIELIDASIAILKGETFELFPDFPTGGLADVSRYNDGLRGGKIRNRAKISKSEKKNELIITEIPFGTTTGSLIESVLAANEKGKIKIKKVDDNTAQYVEIVIQLAPGVTQDIAMDALFAFTDCEISISPNSCVIDESSPRFIGVSEMLRISTNRTLELLRLELEIRRHELDEDWHMSSLEKIFIENRIYLLIEKCETWEDVLSTIDKGLDPFKDILRREIVRDDIIKLTELKIKRISRYDAFKADEHIRGVEKEMEEIDHDLANIVAYTIKYFKRIKQKYGEGRERKTEIRNFDTIEATQVVVANQKLYVNYEEGFAGTGMKKDEYVCDCSDIDDIIVFRRDGTYIITKVADKSFVGKDILHINVFRRNDERTIYNIAYHDGKTGFAYIKRFNVVGITRDKEYNLTQETPGSKLLYFSANPNGEAEVVKVTLKPRPRLKIHSFEYDFSELTIKNRNAMGNILSRNPVHKIVMKEKGESTLGGTKIWFDAETMRLTTDNRGQYLGEFIEGDRIVFFSRSGFLTKMPAELSYHFDDEVLLIEKYNKNRLFSVVYYDAGQDCYFLKRFNFNDNDKREKIIDENPESCIIHTSTRKFARFEIKFSGVLKGKKEIVDAATFIAPTSYKARGKRLTKNEVDKITELEPIIKEEEVVEFEKSKADLKPIFEVEKISDDGTKKIFKL